MGDMKTPDFDDLLAAFDIPDMVDPQAAIESGPNDEHEGQLKPVNGGPASSEDVPSSAQDIGVSVIVKNIRSLDTSEQDGSLQENDSQPRTRPRFHVSVGDGIHNGSLPTISTGKHQSKNGWHSPMEERLPANTPTTTYNQFSPISSAEEFEDDDKIEVDEPGEKQYRQSSFRPTTSTRTDNPSCPKKEESSCGLITLVDGDSKLRAITYLGQAKLEKNNKYGTLRCSKPNNMTIARKPEEQPREAVDKPPARVEPSGLGSDPVSGVSQAKAKTSAKLSSCIAAIAALSSKKARTSDPGDCDCASTQKESTSPLGESPREPKESKSSPEKQFEQESALEVAKRLLSRQPDSPCSVTSDCSSKESPSSPNDTTPVIPKVRIKTIKTSSGQIKRTVTRVLPEFDTEGKSGENSNNAVMVSSVLSSTRNTVFSSTKTSLSTTVLATSGRTSLEIAKQMTIKPVATAFLPVSAVKTAGSQVINLKLANNTTVKATVIPAVSVQSASSAILKAANAIQQQTVMVPASGGLANAKLVPKTVHLTNLNLLPKAVSNNAGEVPQTVHCQKAQQPQRQVKQQTLTTGQLQRKVSKVQVFASSQSTVVDAFNKVLSSINPVPVYVPNLSPPTSACISLPSRGYKCLECGDSFALEKSLAQHYERRSVRIEVTCNHCAKNLVFYNKCSLLSHARGHKDKGVVMQCSHLILKPIPADQMITASPSPGSNITIAGFTSQTKNSTPPALLKATAGGPHTAVISAPSGAPLTAAMPLEDDITRLCRQSLKCMECNQMFQDEISLVMHYQHATESNGQKTCSICQMLLPNQCSFVSHQRIHQHKSPYICPECGNSCRSVHFQSHVTKNCLHYTRRVGYRCFHCSVIFADVATLKSHIQSTHCEVFYKCPICPMAFKSAPGMHSHGHSQHPGTKIGEPKLIHKCSMCDTVFTLQSLLCAHFDQHVGNYKVSVFKCPDCSMHYAQKQLMLDHIKAIHGTLKTTEGPPNLGINLPLSTKPTHSNSNNNNNSSSPNGHGSNKEGGNVGPQDRKPSPLPLKTTHNTNRSGDRKKNPLGPGYTCGECDRVFTTREVFVSHMRRDHSKILKKHPCRQCDKSFSSSHSLCRHNRLKHQSLHKIYSCPHCPPLSQPFTKRVLLDQHIQLMHTFKESESNGMHPDNMEPTPNKVVDPKRKREEGEGLPCRGSNSQPLKKLKVNTLKVHTCAVCGYTSEDAAVFHHHLPQHKSDGSSDQCQECGFCYTSHRSLARHLFIVHRLKEPQALARRGGRGEHDGRGQRENQLDIADENDDGQPSTKCKVCGKVFETEAHLKTHMRTHGMAFIKSKRLSAVKK